MANGVVTPDANRSLAASCCSWLHWVGLGFGALCKAHHCSLGTFLRYRLGSIRLERCRADCLRTWGCLRTAEPRVWVMIARTVSSIRPARCRAAVSGVSLACGASRAASLASAVSQAGNLVACVLRPAGLHGDLESSSCRGGQVAVSGGQVRRSQSTVIQRGVVWPFSRGHGSESFALRERMRLEVAEPPQPRRLASPRWPDRPHVACQPEHEAHFLRWPTDDDDLPARRRFRGFHLDDHFCNRIKVLRREPLLREIVADGLEDRRVSPLALIRFEQPALCSPRRSRPRSLP